MQPSKRINGHVPPTSTLKATPKSTEDDINDATSAVRKHRLFSPPLIVVLSSIVMIDMFSVSLVVPLLHQYYKMAGVSNAGQRELLSSLFSSSQIVGGVAVGALSDSGFLSRRNTLLLSFIGSAISYAMITFGGIGYLVCSRVVVGLVKQTMTVSTAILARHTSPSERAIMMGRLSASSTGAWIIGPSVGALLYKHVDPSAPALVSCGLFIINAIIALFLLPNDGNESVMTTGMESNESSEKPNGETTSSCSDSVTTSKKSNSSSKFASFTNNLKLCFSCKSLASVVTCLLIFHWVTRTTSYASMASYYEERYGIEPHQRGYLSSYQMGLSFLVQSFFVRPILQYAGGEVNAACFAAVAIAVVTFLEIKASFWVFIVCLSPLISMSVSLLGLSLKSLVTQVAPKDSLGSVFAAIDVLQNAAAVTVPFYRTALFSGAAVIARHTYGIDENAAMEGDPDPTIWLLSSGTHWLCATGVLCGLLRRERISSSDRDGETKNGGNDGKNYAVKNTSTETGSSQEKPKIE